MPGWDYQRPAYYVITVVCYDRRAAPLGELEVKMPVAGAAGAEEGNGGWIPCPPGFRLGAPSCPAGAPFSPAGAPSCPAGASPQLFRSLRARVRRSALGEAVFAHFRRMGEFTPGLRPVYCEVMPDHLHFIVQVVEPLARPLGNAIAGFKTGCEKIHARLSGAGRLFAEGFVDEIILRAGQMAAEFNYLHENPLRLAVKRFFPDLFRHSRLIEVAFLGAGENSGLAPRGQNGGLAPRGQNGGLAPRGQDGRSPAIGSAPAALRSAPAAPAAGYFSALGNHFLLSRPLVQVQVSRADFRYRRVDGKIAPDRAVEYESPAFCAKRDRLLDAGRRGAVLLSPCVSEGERQIARLALEAGLRLVAMRNKGIYTEREVFPSLKLEDFRVDLLPLVRREAQNHLTDGKRHPWMDVISVSLKKLDPIRFTFAV